MVLAGLTVVARRLPFDLQWGEMQSGECLELGDLQGALDSISNDLNKHPETQKHHRLLLGHRLNIEGRLNTKEKMREFIEGFK